MKIKIPSKTDSRILLLMLIGAIVVFSAVVLFTGYWEKRADVYMLPDGFKGDAIVVFNDPTGKPEKRNGEKRIFEIPSTGTLYTQSIYKNKWSNYYYIKPDGSLRQLTYGDGRTAGMPGSYYGFDSIWVQEMNVTQRDTGGRKLTIATITVKQLQ